MYVEGEPVSHEDVEVIGDVVGFAVGLRLVANFRRVQIDTTPGHRHPGVRLRAIVTARGFARLIRHNGGLGA